MGIRSHFFIYVIKLVAIFFAADSLALDWNASFEVLSGYRHDEISTFLKTYDKTSHLIETNKLIVDGLDIIDFGFKGRISLAERWSLRIYATWGLIVDGTYHENLSEPGILSQKNSAELIGRLSQDDSISLGYCYPLSSNLSLEGLLGWSYDRLTLKMNHFLEDDLPDLTIDKLYYRMLWKGPWAGGTLRYYRSPFCVSSGYEFHLPDWEGTYWLSGYKMSSQAFSDRRWAKDAQGHVVFAEVSWAALRYCTIGLKAQYQYWLAKNGKSEPILDDYLLQGIPLGQFSRVHRATWSSASIQINVGLFF